MAGSIEIAQDRDHLARWYAARHMETDQGVLSIRYLPTDAPPREIRFLEVNGMISETSTPEPLDFGVDIGSDNARSLYVLDVTPDRWKSIQSGVMPLPNGWTLDGSRELGGR